MVIFGFKLETTLYQKVITAMIGYFGLKNVKTFKYFASFFLKLINIQIEVFDDTYKACSATFKIKVLQISSGLFQLLRKV